MTITVSLAVSSRLGQRTCLSSDSVSRRYAIGFIQKKSLLDSCQVLYMIYEFFQDGGEEMGVVADAIEMAGD